MNDDSSDKNKPQEWKGGLQKRGRAYAKSRKTAKDDGSDNGGADGAAPRTKSRVENPHILRGQSYDICQEPLAPTFSVTEYQRCHRRLTLRNRIAPHPVTSEELDDHLNATGWNVDHAYYRWHTRHMQAIAAVCRGELARPSFETRVPHRHCSSDGGEVSVESQGSDVFVPYPHDADPERERRGLVIFLWKLLEEARAVGSVPLRRSEAIMLLRETYWDVIQARDLYLEHQVAFDAFTNSYGQFHGPAQVRSERDNRLASMIDLTGRQDIDSLQAHLNRHNYNFIAAVVAWQKSGIPVIPGEDRADVADQDPVSDHCFWWDESPSDMEEEKEDSNKDDQEEDVVKHGFLINPDRQGALKGVPDHTKMFIEYTHNGKYKAHAFKHKGYRWSSEHPQDRLDFDFNNQDNIHHLNNWRREIFRRKIGNMTDRPQRTSWLEVEDDFLYELHRALWDELIVEHPDENPQNFLPLPVPASRQREWARRFNEEFEGTAQEDSEQVRPHRSYGAINTRRHRVQRIINDFRLERNNPHPKGNEEDADQKSKTSKTSKPLPKSIKAPTKDDNSSKSHKATKRNRDEIDDVVEEDDGDQDARSESEREAGQGGRGSRSKAPSSKEEPALKMPKTAKGRKRKYD